MKLNKFFDLVNLYRVVKDAPDGPTVGVMPSEYLKKLNPHQAIAELKSHIKSLQDELGNYTTDNIEAPENHAKIRKLELQLKVAQNYLARPTKILKTKATE